MPNLDKPLTADERKKFQEIMNSDELFAKMVERAVKGRREHVRRTSRARTPPR